MTNIFQLPQASFIPRRAIDEFTAYVTIEEICHDELEITEHPIEQGASITDHAYVKPSLVHMKISFGYGLNPFNFENPIETYNKILQLQRSREPFRLVTGKRAYNNMLIKSLTERNDAMTESILSLSLTLKENFIVEVSASTTALPQNQEDQQATEAIQNSGEKLVKKVESPELESVLKSFVGR